MADEQDPPEGSTNRESYLSVLSQAQYDAVTANPDEPLQILAGPGSGKTRVLVSRVAWLILEKGINPRDLVVVTFTNKAANEMKERLTKLIGKERTTNLVLGTFHATCARYLRFHASKVEIKNNFTIYDSDDQQRYFKKLFKENTFVSEMVNGMKSASSLFMNEISKAKAKNVTASEYKKYIEEVEAEMKLKNKWSNKGIHKMMETVYPLYEKHLRENNCLDFDDLLMFGLKLVSEHGKVIANLRHVLVDEFQDTNSIQYALMSHMAGRSGSRGSVSIVGDPDQSIYGWRSAEVGNLETMAKEFAAWTEGGEIKRVFLEENYRSTGRILEVAKAVIEGSSSRIDRGLFTSHKAGPNVILANVENQLMEASLIATEIKRLVACSGGLYTFDDFAILLRFNALSRNVEQQLLQDNIPCRILGGARFFERKEVKDLLAYLTLADNPECVPALERIINVPKRKIGDATLSSLKEVAGDQNISTMEHIEQIASGKKFSELKSLPKSALEKFADVIREIRQMGQRGEPVDIIMFRLIEMTKFEDHLKKEPDFEQRWENVKELINFGSMVMRGIGLASNLPALETKGDDDEDYDDDNEDSQVRSSYLSSLVSQINQRSSQKLPTQSSSSLSSQIDQIVSQIDPPSAKKKTSTSKKAKNEKKSEPDIVDLLSSSDEEDNVKSQISKTAGKKDGKTKAKEEEEEELHDEEEEEIKKTPLQIFIESCTLSTDVQDDNDKDGKKAPKVTIATAHAAKGLEFPVVFVVSAESDTFPFYRSQNSQEEIDEETRLLYVAITRAQTLCYLIYADIRTVFGEERSKELSPFIARIADGIKFRGGSWREEGNEHVPIEGGYVDGPSIPSIKKKKLPKVDFGDDRPNLSMDDIRIFCSILNRPEPPEDRVNKLTSAFKASDYAKKANKIRMSLKSSSSKSNSKHDDSGYGNSLHPNNRPCPPSFSRKDFTNSDFGKGFSRPSANGNFTPFSSGAFISGQSSGFTSASTLLAGLNKPLKTTDPNVNLSNSAFSQQKGNGKRLGVGRAPAGSSTTKKSKKE